MFKSTSATPSKKIEKATFAAMSSIHQFKVTSLNGGEIDFSAFAGKKIMVVNTASECGLTPQYEQLQELHENFFEKLAIVGFPCNDFAGQEPGSASEIEKFCVFNYGVTFPLSEKVSVVGDTPHPVYKWLRNQSENGVESSEVEWNFQKYLLDEKGEYVKMLAPSVIPIDEQILEWLK